jgi:hypothetical protein
MSVEIHITAQDVDELAEKLALLAGPLAGHAVTDAAPVLNELLDSHPVKQLVARVEALEQRLSARFAHSTDAEVLGAADQAADALIERGTPVTLPAVEPAAPLAEEPPAGATAEASRISDSLRAAAAAGIVLPPLTSAG